MNKSDSIKELATALSKFQSETVDAIKDKKGDKGSYADLGQILNLVRPLMSKHGLSVAQLPCESAIEGNIAVDTMLMHKSGEWISNSFSMPINRIIRKADQRDVTNAPQASGSVITYARRYALTAVLGITQEDNDAAIARKEANKDYSKCIEAYAAETNKVEQGILWDMCTPEEQRAISNHFAKQG